MLLVFRQCQIRKAVFPAPLPNLPPEKLDKSACSAP